MNNQTSLRTRGYQINIILTRSKKIKFPFTNKQTIALLVLHLGQPSPQNSTTEGEKHIRKQFYRRGQLEHAPASQPFDDDGNTS